jgi:CelD/BcsL family acetyltransferase involved in cellulose biosynthesis
LAARVEPFDDLDAVARDAAGALDRGAQPSLFHRLDWFRLVHRHTPLPGRLLVLRAEEEGGRAWLFLSVDRGHAQALANWYSLRFGIVGAAGLEAPLARALREAGIASIELHPLVPGDPLAAALRRQGWLVRTAPSTVTWRMATAGQDFASYWASRPARLRNTGERKAKAAGLDIAIHSRFDPAAWADYEAVYDASWKPAEGSPAFLRDLAEMEGAAGTLRLGIARKDGRPVAAQLWLVENGVATIHKLAYAEDAKALSPGTILSMAMFRRALDVDRVEAIDFGLGDDPYKADWIDGRTPMERLVAYDLRRPRGLLALARALAVKLVRSRRSG